jgi:hypothetical protein
VGGAWAAARAHGREGLVTGRVEEREQAPLQLDLVRADVLGDAARFALGDMLRADDVQ